MTSYDVSWIKPENKFLVSESLQKADLFYDVALLKIPRRLFNRSFELFSDRSTERLAKLK